MKKHNFEITLGGFYRIVIFQIITYIYILLSKILITYLTITNLSYVKPAIGIINFAILPIIYVFIIIKYIKPSKILSVFNIFLIIILLLFYNNISSNMINTIFKISIMKNDYGGGMLLFLYSLCNNITILLSYIISNLLSIVINKKR